MSGITTLSKQGGRRYPQSRGAFSLVTSSRSIGAMAVVAIYNIVDRMVQMQVIRSEVTKVGQAKAQGITLGQVRTKDATF